MTGADGSTGYANTFLIGAQKSGTTYLAALLEQSRDVCIVEGKEPHFFTTGYAAGLDAYRRLFADPSAKIRLDASTTYGFLRPAPTLGQPGAPGIDAPVPERIRDAAPEARFIYIMRDPVARAKSAYMHNLRKEPPPPGPVSLPDALRRDPMLVIPGLYAAQIERYLAVFPREKFLFLDFAELTSDPAAVLARTCGFLGISSEGMETETSERARHGAIRLSGVGRALANSGIVRGLSRRLLPTNLRQEFLHRYLSEPAQVTFLDEAEAAEFFADDRARLPALTGLSI